MSLIRPAGPGDLGCLVEIQHREPSPEFVALAGSVAAARRLGRAVTVSGGTSDASRPTVVLERRGRPVGLLQYALDGSSAGEISAALAVRVVLALGWRVAGLPRRFATSRAVELRPPAGSLYLAELHVHPAWRGQGVGSELLEWSASRADELQIATRSLVTRTNNPAIRLYERHGFEVVAVTEDDRYQRLVGATGRVLMTAPAGSRLPRGGPGTRS